ncbi:hypothetical protein LshimejAT787_0409770 [Lyophyllum shimeji]|uniref:Uncharacterized protein n=1 Tax=Lyophyllum shimeji TaxID=47721 RepID=A0A9P3PLK3_LYOSH|nr:hypothetical protein LshimejAT787_0409770 [Lyophyllum shimeji]
MVFPSLPPPPPEKSLVLLHDPGLWPKIQVTPHSILCLAAHRGRQSVLKGSLPPERSSEMRPIETFLQPEEHIMAFHYLERPRLLLTVIRRLKNQRIETYLDVCSDSSAPTKFRVSIGSYAPTSTATVLATRTFVGVLFKANSANLRGIDTRSHGLSNPPVYDWRSDSSDFFLYNFQSRTFTASIHVPEMTMTSFSFLTADDPRIITTNPQAFALELWIVKSRNGLEKAGILELPTLSSEYACQHLHCAPLDTTERTSQPPQTAIVVDFRLSPRRTPHVGCISGQFIVSVAFLLSLPVWSVDLRMGPVIKRWSTWGAQAQLCEGTFNTNDSNPFSGHYFTTCSASRAAHPSFVSVYDLRRPSFGPYAEIQLQTDVDWGAEIVPHAFQYSTWARLIDEEDPAYQATLQSERLFYYEGLLFALRSEEEKVLITIVLDVATLYLTAEMVDCVPIDDSEAATNNENTTCMRGLSLPPTSDDVEHSHWLDSQGLENLELLASCCPSALESDDFLKPITSCSDTDHDPNTPEDPAADIATPVPLPYSVRSSSVLERMISGPKETLQHSMTLAEQLERSHGKAEDGIKVAQLDSVDSVTELAYPFAHRPVCSSASYAAHTTHTFRPIRPASPATLIALAEPCLMAWCVRAPPLPNVPVAAKAISHPRLPASPGAQCLPTIPVEVLSTPRQGVWGY